VYDETNDVEVLEDDVNEIFQFQDRPRCISVFFSHLKL
jgi:hypothetical protein